MCQKYMRFITISLFLFVMAGYSLCLAQVTTETAPEAEAQRQWATPLEREGLPNLHKVSDDLYRGAQPSAEGMQALKAMGIKTVVNLRGYHSDADELGDLQLEYFEIPIPAWKLKEEHVVRFLQIATDPNRMPVFVHCQHGADRTGVMSAVYRIVVQGWSKADALKEMTEGGFGFHSIWKNYIRFIENLDIEALKKKLD